MDLVAQFKQHRQTMALVVNEFGDVVGLATLNDVMEALVGDIATADDEHDRDIVPPRRAFLARRRQYHRRAVQGRAWHRRRRCPRKALGTYHTIAGFALLQLDRVPRVADRFEWHGWTLEVVDMDGNRVDKLLVTRPPPGPAPEEP